MEEKKKIRVLVVPSDNGGCRYWRMERPHLKLQEMYGDEFDVVIANCDNINWRDLSYFEQFDILDVHKGLFPDLEGFRNVVNFCKEKNITTIIDIDDYWDLGQFHPMTAQNRLSGAIEKTLDNLKMVDYVTTTTDIFANKIKKYNKNTNVFPNAIDTEDHQWDPDYSKEERIRFGFVMGSSHERDMELVRGVVNQLGKDILDKIQIVLCGYDLRGTMSIIGKDGQIESQRPIKPQESVWYTFEKNVTDDYKICDPEYKKFLQQFIPNAQYPGVESKPYRREWTKDLTCFATHYNHLDVLLVPLNTQEFNLYKSELKVAEAGFKHKAIVMSNFGAYKIGSKSMFQKGGVIDKTGNCVLIEPGTDHKAWAKTIKKLVENPELIDILKDNLSAHAHANYDLADITKRRAEWYKSIVKR